MQNHDSSLIFIISLLLRENKITYCMGIERWMKLKETSLGGYVIPRTNEWKVRKLSLFCSI